MIETEQLTEIRANVVKHITRVIEDVNNTINQLTVDVDSRVMLELENWININATEAEMAEIKAKWYTITRFIKACMFDLVDKTLPNINDKLDDIMHIVITNAYLLSDDNFEVLRQDYENDVAEYVSGLVNDTDVISAISQLIKDNVVTIGVVVRFPLREYMNVNE